METNNRALTVRDFEKQLQELWGLLTPIQRNKARREIVILLRQQDREEPAGQFDEHQNLISELTP